MDASVKLSGFAETDTSCGELPEKLPGRQSEVILEIFNQVAVIVITKPQHQIESVRGLRNMLRQKTEHVPEAEKPG
ncbi:hypothetical protein GCM10027347_27780 [Larkinella harenae]